jgi:hypothetical protein
MARSTTLNATMNMKERMLAVLQGGELDRVPFVAYDGVTATNEEVWRALGDDEMGIIRWSKVHQIVHPDVRFESRPISMEGQLPGDRAGYPRPRERVGARGGEEQDRW